MKIRLTVLILVLVFWITSINSPKPFINYFKNETVNCVLYHNNSLWAATDEGLLIWDINNCTYTKYSYNDGIPTSEITSITTDYSGNQWIGTVQNNIFKFDGQNWTNYTQSSVEKNHINKES